MSFQPPPSRELSWAKPLSIDLILKVLNVTFLHPFVAWMVPLCMRAQAMTWTATAMQVAIGYASLLTALYFLGVLNRQIAYSKPRKVDFSEEVIVVTGGASGLGLLIAEVYGMRGATVAVLDVKDLEAGEARGVSVYKCDVGDKEQVAKVAVEIERDVSYLLPSLSMNFTDNAQLAWYSYNSDQQRRNREWQAPPRPLDRRNRPHIPCQCPLPFLYHQSLPPRHDPRKDRHNRHDIQCTRPARRCLPLRLHCFESRNYSTTQITSCRAKRHA